MTCRQICVTLWQFAVIIACCSVTILSLQIGDGELRSTTILTWVDREYKLEASCLIMDPQPFTTYSPYILLPFAALIHLAWQSKALTKSLHLGCLKNKR